MHVADPNKPSTTSAAKTAFCVDRLDYGSEHLWIDGNGKITAGNGTLADPKPNAFSLVQILDCPFHTPSCGASCYVHNLEKFAPDVHRLYRHNSEMMRSIVSTSQTDGWAGAMADYITENCSGGFRWHVSGDVFSRAYAVFIAEVCRRSPRVRHWIYTRSFPFVDALMPVAVGKGGNLVINLSADKDNRSAAISTAIKHNLRICYMTIDGDVANGGLMAGDVIFPDYTLRGGTPEGAAWFDGLPPKLKQMVCPVDFHGKAENRRCGPCARCLRDVDWRDGPVNVKV